MTIYIFMHNYRPLFVSHDLNLIKLKILQLLEQEDLSGMIFDLNEDVIFEDQGEEIHIKIHPSWSESLSYFAYFGDSIVKLEILE